MYNVMIVDDELWFRSYLKELIDQSGSEFLVCAQAANGAEALKILAAQPVDVPNPPEWSSTPYGAP